MLSFIAQIRQARAIARRSYPILSAVAHLESGVTREQVGRWRVKAEPITRDVTTILRAGPEERPLWWSQDHACRFVLKQQVAGPGCQKAPGQVNVGFPVPYLSYINPVERKARLPQGEPGRPFLIVVDMGNLPGAFREIPRGASRFLSGWRHVSGILLYHDTRGTDRVGWTWRLIGNPHADIALPVELAGGRADLPQAMDSYRLVQARAE